MNTSTRPLAVVTGASSGIGLELAKLCAEEPFDLIVAADEARIREVASQLSSECGVLCAPIECDLATLEGVDALVSAIEQSGRPVEALLANAGRGLGRAFLDQDIAAALKVVHTNIDGTICLIHRVAGSMRQRGQGRVLITGSIAGLMPGSFQAVYNGTKAFLDSFSVALREELKDSGVSVTCLMPGATETDFFERADMMDTKVGTEEKAAAAEVAKTGFDAMMKGESKVIAGAGNKMRAAMTNVLSDEALAKQHSGMAAPGTAKHQ
ncbi:MAG TPA: SDR family NAD(P)-dependent oxidoreductase [Steroidobacteraceae bacterium]|jgi:short-subunit dehydrogenase|nr:SDR family NAD(P)-dependent oxidoreductase [Steroidobacteraceae bacterium]